MGKRGIGRIRRVFGYVGDLEAGSEVMLSRVVTWSSVEHLEAACDPRRSKEVRELYSYRVVPAQSGGVVSGGMSLPVNAADAGSWLVKLGDNCAAPNLRPGDRVTLLDSAWCGGDGAALWRLFAREVRCVGVTASGPQNEVWL